MKLSIITVNLNNAIGLKKTMDSVFSQSSDDMEYIVIDGASSDNSLQIIESYKDLKKELRWISEPDKGIYEAMNKGIRLAKGDYVQFLNSSDILTNDHVVENMLKVLTKYEKCDILYGNILKQTSPIKHNRDRAFAGKEITFLRMFTRTLNHPSCYINRELFNIYGLYDESYQIVSDWKWFLKSVIIGNITPIYTNIDVVVFDMGGISNTRNSLVSEERQRMLQDLFPLKILIDYERWSWLLRKLNRLRKC